MNSKEKIIEQIVSCNLCNECINECPTYTVTKDESFSPPSRLKVAEKLYRGEDLTSKEIESLYNCPQCGLCDSVCPQEIMISEIMSECRGELVTRGLGPLEKHERVVEGILKLGNSVNGDPNKRWDWLPGDFPKNNESDTLFYVGCLPAYLVSSSARSSYLILKKLEIDFMMDKNEDCCGIYFYNAGRWDLAREKFEENRERFRKLGIKKIITACAGCYYCFKRYYPRILGESEIEVLHVVEILPSLLRERKTEVKQLKQEVTYLDPCRLGRKEGIYDPPRETLSLCGVEIKEMKKNRGKAICCGAGAGIRSVYRNLSFNIALQTLDMASVDTIVVSCPFCSFNLSYAAKKGKKNKTLVHITDLVLKSLSPDLM